MAKGPTPTRILYSFLIIWNLVLWKNRKFMDIYTYYFKTPARLVNFGISTHTILEYWLGIWNLCQKTIGFRILYRNLGGVGPLSRWYARFAVNFVQNAISEHAIFMGVCPRPLVLACWLCFAQWYLLRMPCKIWKFLTILGNSPDS